MKLEINLLKSSYDVIIEKNSLSSVNKFFNLDRKVLIVTDDNVPTEYSDIVKNASRNAIIKVVPNGEKSKSIKTAQNLLKEMLNNNFGRNDCVVAVGGGVVGDLAGFVASLYMRGIDFFNIPTTVLSQVDSSIGGKVAVNFEGIKNIIGAFYQPKGVLIDTQTLKSLPERQIKNGLIEALKSGAIKDKDLFEIFERGIEVSDIENIIYKSLSVKKAIVENDEKEKGERKLLNFGHTLGHGIESAANGRLFHGECVALGMYLISNNNLKERLKSIYEKLGIWDNIFHIYSDILTKNKKDIEKAIIHDKKATNQICSAVIVNEVGKGEIKDLPIEEIISFLR